MKLANQRILFVDDEPMILSGLKRMLRSSFSDWEMDFVDRGAKALDLMREKQFDVVVSDMRMPGMNGADLLEAVMKEHPHTVRLILSGYADQDLIMRSVGSTHQFLAKPCEAADLKSTINRACTMKDSLNGSNVLDVVSRMKAIPSLPRLYLDVVEKLKNPDSDISDIADIIKQDIGMTTNILKLVNSAFFGSGRKVMGVDDAVAQLGLKLLKELVLVAEIFSQYENDSSLARGADALWSHSQDVAERAKQILEVEGGSAADKEAVFVAAMLHDVGKLILASNFPDEYPRLLAANEAAGECLSGLEKERFGASHAEVGSYLLGLWGLSEPVVDAIALHHKPEHSVYKDFGALTALHIADALSNKRSGNSKWCGPSVLSEDYLKQLGLWDKIPAWGN